MAAGLLALPLHAAPPPDRAKLLQELDAIEKQQKETQTGSLGGVLTEVAAAQADAGAALDLYEKAVFTVRFDGAKGDRTEFNKWLKQKEDVLRDPFFTKALSLHLQYLALTIRAARGEDPAKLAGPALDFVHALWDLPRAADTAAALAAAVAGKEKGRDRSRPKDADVTEPREGAELLDQSVADGVIAKYYQLDSLLSGLKDWAFTPSRYAEILKQDVFPPFRADKNPALIGVWDEYIALDTEKAERNPLADQRTRFETETLPSLRWDRAQDLVAVGRTDEGVQEMFAIIRGFPLHPDNPQWIATLRATLQGTPPAPDQK